MSELFFDELEIPHPKYNLGIGSATHGVQTGRMLSALDELVLNERPDCVLVYGDTNSTLAGALCAVKLHTFVAHVEAGLRSFNRRMPEEINRIIADHTSDILFAPTDIAVQNLRSEGIHPEKIFLSGDVMYDATLYYAARADRTSNILEQLHIESKQFVLATIHRAENTDDSIRLHAILQALSYVGRDVPVVLPMHPRTRARLSGELSALLRGSNVRVVEPIGYLEMIVLEKHATCIVTDSGGVQKEAYFQSVPCVTVRDETEWLELVSSGWNTLASPSAGAEAIAATIGQSLENVPTEHPPLYGDGDAATKISDTLRLLQNRAESLAGIS